MLFIKYAVSVAWYINTKLLSTIQNLHLVLWLMLSTLESWKLS